MSVKAILTGQDSGGNNILLFENMPVAASAWVASTIYNDYGYQATITCQGVTTSHLPIVTFNEGDSVEYEFSSVANSGANSVTIYAKKAPESVITIPTISCSSMNGGNSDQAIQALETSLENRYNGLSDRVDSLEESASAPVSEGRDPYDLTIIFADEIAASPYNGDEWAWIKGRIQDGNFAGIMPGDWIPFEYRNGYNSSTYYTLNAEVAGINTYKDTGVSSASGNINNHIDFISDKIVGTASISDNALTINNAARYEFDSPWLFTELFYYLNSSSGAIVEDLEIADDTLPTENVDFIGKGAFDNLPQKLQNVISTKYLYLESRYPDNKTNTLGVTAMGTANYESIGKLWLPTEMEIYGTPLFSSPKGDSIGSVQYPIFRNYGLTKRRKIRASGAGGSYGVWWLLDPADGNSTHWCAVSANAQAITRPTNAGYYYPICFRVMASNS